MQLPSFRRVPTYELSPEAGAVLLSISTAAGGEPVSDLLSEAIGLLALVADAKRNGKRVLIVDEAGDPEREIELGLPLTPISPPPLSPSPPTR